MSEEEKSALLYKARCCEEMERYEMMAQFMKAAAENGKAMVEAGMKEEIFDQGERNLFSVAYKNVVGTRRSAWRVATAKEMKMEESVERNWCIDLKNTVEKELNEICKEVLSIIDDILIGNASDSQTKVFYLKMQGDYYRYLAEINQKDSKTKDDAKDAYQKAVTEAKVNLATTHPIRLGLALNFSVFYYEILNEPDAACKLAKEAFDDAIADLDSLREDSYKDSTLIMQLLRDNLTLWTSNGDDQDQDQDP